MSQDQYDILIRRIHHHCQYLLNQVYEQKRRCCKEDYGFSYRDHLYTFLALRGAETPLPEFAFPPVIEAQVDEAEEKLGFALPSLLRLLYLRIANGGFGPGYGIIGLPEGFPLEDGFGQDIIEGYHSLCQEGNRVQLEDYEMIIWEQWLQSWGGTPSSKPEMGKRALYVLPQGVWPEGLLPLCYWGCAIGTYIDVRTEQVFQCTGYEQEIILLSVASSLEDWLKRWLDGEPLQFL